MQKSRKSSKKYDSNSKREDYYKMQLELEKEKNNDIIMNLKNKITILENKTNRLQSMNEVFLDLLKK